MSRVVFLGFPALGHINPTIGVVKELIARGEEVIYFSETEFQAKIESMGAEFRDYLTSAPTADDIMAPEEDPSELKKGYGNDLNKLMKLFIHSMKLYLAVMRHPKQDLKAIVAALKPDYIIHDSVAYWGKVLSKQLAIPAISSVTMFAYCEAMFEKYPEFVISDILHLSGAYLDDLRLTRQLLQRVSKMLEGLYKIEGFDCIDSSCSTEALNIVYTSKEFQWFADSFDSSFKFVGPSLSPRIDARFPWRQLNGKGLIYISFGSIFSHEASNLEFYHQCVEAFRNSGRQVVLNIGNQRREDIGTIPSNFMVGNDLPQLDILKHAALFITHGGMNSVNEALYFNVPMLVIPHKWDQFLVARRVAELGTGINMYNMKLTASELFESAQQVLTNESYRRNCEIIGESLRKAGGYQRAADEIFAFKRQNNIQ